VGRDRAPLRHQTEEARRAFEEALKIYEAYAKQNPEQFSSDVKRVKKLLEELHRQGATQCDIAGTVDDNSVTLITFWQRPP
jgi:hypothetical protein